MSRRLRHRGPDDDGVYLDPACDVALGVRRLSIVDLEGGHQPLSNEDGSVWVAFNGEIYNHRELREHLRARGHRFHTETDTEVLVHLYEEYGDALVHALDGMFAFAIWDARGRRLLLARDHFGEKPLFYSMVSGALTFASELTAVRAGGHGGQRLDPAAMDAYLVLGYVPGPGTLMEDILQLPPACTLTWEQGDRDVRVSRYWSPPVNSPVSGEPRAELVAETARLLETSLRSRLKADVPVGVFLSGGVDSTLVALLSADATGRPVKTFTVGYDDPRFSETEPARATARILGCEHHELRVDDDTLDRQLSSLYARLDQPIADQALLPLNALAEHARRHVKVVVGGEGADELFGGYPRYKWLSAADRVQGVMPAGPGRTVASRLSQLQLTGRARHVAGVLEPMTTMERHLEWVTGGRLRMRTALYGPRLREHLSGGLYGGLTPASGQDLGDLTPEGLMRFDQLQWLPDDVLAKADRASMLASLEVRTPYLQRQISEFAASIPMATHTAHAGKSLLRQVLAEKGPAGISSRRPKKAFQVPAARWLRGPLAPLVDQQLQGGGLYADGWLARSAVQRLAAEHSSGAHDRTEVLWPVLVLGLWYDAQAAFA